MEILLERIELNGATPGTLFLPGVGGLGNTLEDMVRPAGQYIPKITAIPYGKFRLIISFSNRFKKQMIQVINVRGGNIMFGPKSIDMAGIRIHGANDVDDVEGCIGVGQNRKPDGIGIYNCKPAVDRLFNLVRKADQHEEVYLNIVRKS